MDVAGSAIAKPKEIALQLPRAANDSFLIADALHADRSVTLAARGARASAYEVASGDAVAHDVFPSVDEIVTVRPSAWESFYLLKDKSAAHEFHWQVTLGSAIRSVGRGGDGSLLFQGEGNEVALAMPAPLAVDATGKEIRPTLAYADGDLAITFDPAGVTYPVLLDPTITSWSWVKQSTGVANLSNNTTCLTYDEDRSVAVFFGGSTSAGFSSSTLEWNGTLWTKVSLATSPSARSSHSTTYDSVRKRLLLFGGQSSNSIPLGDFWEYNGSTWVERTPSTLPTKRYWASMAFNEFTGKAVLFGGFAATIGVNAETWEWDGTTWTKKTPAHSPPARYLAGFAYDANRKVLVLHGGNNPSSVTLSDTWEYDGTDWTDKSSGSLGTVADGFRLVYDRAAKKILRVGGNNIQADALEVKVWDGSTWKTDTTPTLTVFPSNGAAYDTKRGVVLALSSTALSSSTSGGGAWTTKSSTTAPAVTNYAPYGTYAPGLGGAFFAPPTSTEGWVWDGSYWTKKTISTTISGSGIIRYVYDPGSVRVLAVEYLTDTAVWAWSGAGWTKQSGLLGASKAQASATYDSQRNRVVLFGGQTNGGELWEWDSVGGWAKKTTATAPIARRYPVMGYDPTRHITVMAGGSSVGNTDTWEYDGTDFTKITTAHTPNVFCGSLVYDTQLGKFVLFSTDTTVWEYDGTDWTKRLVANATSAQPQSFPTTGAEFNFDGRSPILFVTTDLSLWRLNANYGGCTSDAECPNGLLCTDSVCCTSKTCNTCETCNGTNPGVCTPVVNQTDSDSCTGTNTCDSSGTCKSNIGTTCSAASQCASGFCVDGVCCDSACTGTCVACKDTMKEELSRNGLCGAALHGTDVRNQCSSTAASTCGLDGMCDGKGGCRLYTKGTICSSAISCPTDGTATPQVCDGLGSCGPQAPSTNCGGYKCTTNVGCGTTCTTDNDCATNYRCDGTGKCTTKSNFGIGNACVNGFDCASGFCVDGVCCDTACNGTCVSCKNTLKADSSVNGTCGPSLAGTDPRNQCDTTDKSTCGTEGMCDGKGACRLYAKGTACGAGVVCPTENSATGVVCDGLGVCGNSAEVVNCNGFKCVTDEGCGNSCTADKDCVTNYRCDEQSKCVEKLNLAQGAACTKSVDCASGSCVDGVCCDTACNGLCLSCTAALKADGSKDGTCGPTRLGSDPKNQCEDSPVATCGQDGFCDGAGACHKYASGTACGADTTCLTASTVTGQICDGLGSCTKRTDGVDCKGFVCSPGAGCLVTCTNDAECVTGFYCADQTCVPRSGSLCADDHHVASPDGNIDCGNYVCRAGACLTGCTSVDDCLSGLVCDFNGRCIAPPTLDPGSDGGCSLGGPPSATSGEGAIFAFAALAMVRARRRRESRVPH